MRGRAQPRRTNFGTICGAGCVILTSKCTQSRTSILGRYSRLGLLYAGPTLALACSLLPNFLHDATTSESLEMCAAPPIAHWRPISYAAICQSCVAPSGLCAAGGSKSLQSCSLPPAVCSSCLNNGRRRALLDDGRLWAFINDIQNIFGFL